MRPIVILIQVIFIITLFGACKDSDLQEKEKAYLCPIEGMVKIDTRETKPSTSYIRYYKDGNNAEWLIIYGLGI